MKPHNFERNFDSLETLAETISEALDCPVTIEDSNHRLLAYSTHDEATDPARIATIISRRVPEQVISSLWNNGTIEQLMSTTEPVRVRSNDSIGLGNRVAISIQYHQEIIGYIWILETEKQLDEHDLHLLTLASQAVRTKLLQARAIKQDEDIARIDFFWKLLTGYYKNVADINNKALELQMELPTPFINITLQLTDYNQATHQQQIRYFLNTNQCVRVICHVFTNDLLIILATSRSKSSLLYKDSLQFIHDLCSILEDKLHLFQTIAAIGGIYEPYTLVEKSYQESIAVLEIKRQFPSQTRALNHYSDLGIYRHLPYLIQQQRITGYTNPKLVKLTAYDCKHGSSMLETLDAYLTHNCNIKLTSEKLFIHSNTLIYRLNRIAEIGGIDLDNNDQKINLYIDLLVDKCAGQHSNSII